MNRLYRHSKMTLTNFKRLSSLDRRFQRGSRSIRGFLTDSITCIITIVEASSCLKPGNFSHTGSTRKHQLRYLIPTCLRSILPTFRGFSRTLCSPTFTSKDLNSYLLTCSSTMPTPTRPSFHCLSRTKQAICNEVASGIKPRRSQPRPRLVGTDSRVSKVLPSSQYKMFTPIVFQTSRMTRSGQSPSGRELVATYSLLPAPASEEAIFEVVVENSF